MNSRWETGFPEIALICGAFVSVYGSLVMGTTLCTLGVLGAISRTGLRIQKEQQEEEARQALLKEVQNAGGDLADSLISFLSKSSQKKTVH